MRKRFAKFLPHLVIAAFIYGNLAALIKNCTRFGTVIPGQISPLPAPDPFFVLFDTIGVFKIKPTMNIGYLAYGLKERVTTAPMVPDPKLTKIDLYEMLNLPLPEVNFNWASGGFAARAAPEIKAEMAQKVQEYYNRKHPDSPVHQVWVFRAEWAPHDYHYWGNFDQATFLPWAHN